MKVGINKNLYKNEVENEYRKYINRRCWKFDFDGEQNDKYVGIDRDVLYIDEIFIEKKYRNMGIGRDYTNFDLSKLYANADAFA